MKSRVHLIIIDYPGLAWLLAVVFSLNTALADQQVVFAVDSTLTADELRDTHQVVSDVLQKADATTRAGMIIFDRVVTQVINLQENTDAFKTLVDSSMAAVIADRMNVQQDASSHPASGIERSIAELKMRAGSASRPLVVLFTSQSRLDAAKEEIERQFQWLNMILLPELERLDGALLLVTSYGSLENRLVKTVLGFSENLHLPLSSGNAIVERIWLRVSSAQEQEQEQGVARLEQLMLTDTSVDSEPVDSPRLTADGLGAVQATPDERVALSRNRPDSDDAGVEGDPDDAIAINQSLTFIRSHSPIIIASGLFFCVLLTLLLFGRFRKPSPRRVSARLLSQGLVNESEHYLPLNTTRQRYFSKAIQHNDNRAPKAPASVTIANSERAGDAQARDEAVTVVLHAEASDVKKA